MNDDETLKRGPGRPRKLTEHGESEERKDRAMEDRTVTERRELSDAQRIAEFEAKFMEAVLPTLPPIPGFHTIWLSATHNQDTIAQRIRLGYTMIKPSDLPGWDLAGTLQTGEYAGGVGMKEMIAFKLPDELYQAYMTINHVKRPMQEEEKLKANIAQQNETARSKGGAVLGVGDGFDQMGRYAETPDFLDPNWRPKPQYLRG